MPDHPIETINARLREKIKKLEEENAKLRAREECFREFMVWRGWFRDSVSEFRIHLEKLESSLVKLGYEYEEFT